MWTKNLKLRIDSSLTADAKFNLNRLDLLGSLISAGDDGTTNIRASGDILIEPNSSVVGGSGSGGTVNIGGTLDLDSPLLITEGGTGASTQQAAIDNLVPPHVANQYLRTDGANVFWAPVTGAGAVIEWDNADGTELIINHNLGTRDIFVQVYDGVLFEEVNVTIVRTDTDNITVSSAVPPPTQYRVLIISTS